MYEWRVLSRENMQHRIQEHTKQWVTQGICEPGFCTGRGHQSCQWPLHKRAHSQLQDCVHTLGEADGELSCCFVSDA